MNPGRPSFRTIKALAECSKNKTGDRRRLRELAILTLVAGAPAILGASIGGYITSDMLSVLFFALAAGVAIQVVVEVARFVARRPRRAYRRPRRRRISRRHRNHVRNRPARRLTPRLHGAEQLLEEKFKIAHCTLQIDVDHTRGLPIHKRGSPEAAPRTAPVPVTDGVTVGSDAPGSNS